MTRDSSPSRKRHTKSRAGCLNCKARRVKCDETKPSCRNCLRRCTLCRYTDPEPIKAGRRRGAVTASVGGDGDGDRDGGSVLGMHSPSPLPDSLLRPLSTGPSVPSSAASCSGVSRSEELWLMHHYSTMAWATLANVNSPDEVDLWKHAVPREGMRHDFLMDSLLAFSAFHLAHLEPLSSRAYYLTVGAEYKGRSLVGFKAALNCIDDANTNALFASSLIITILTFLVASSSSVIGTCLTPCQSLQSIYELLRGTGAIIGESDRAVVHIRTGMFQSLLDPSGGGPAASHDVVDEEGCEEAMTRLTERIDQVAKFVSPEQRQIYVSSVHSLRDAFQHVLTRRNISAVVAWPSVIDRRLMELLQQGDPTAQLLWIHYGVLLLYIDQHWWGKGFGLGLIRSLSAKLHALDDEWAVYTGWCLQCAKTAEERAMTFSYSSV